ncbi:MAG: LptF/LptG family permease [Acidobacteriota bacterium]
MFREIFASAVLGCILFTTVLFFEGSRKLFEFVANNSGPTKTIAYLFALVLPQSLPFTIPLGVLVGTLITLSRKSSDGEITAMRAAGIPGRRVAPAVLAFAFLGLLIAGCASVLVKPWAVRESIRLKNDLLADQSTALVQPRIFEERFQNTVLYVTDAGTPGPVSQVLWKKVMIVDVSPAPERSDIPSLTLASEVIAAPDRANNRIQLKITKGYNYAATKDVNRYEIRTLATDERGLNVEPPKLVPSHPSTEMDMGPLIKAAYRTPSLNKQEVLEARIELHQRVALPFACIVLAFAGISLGITSRRSGRSSAVVLTAALALFYDMTLISMTNLAQQGTLPAELAMWTPNLLFAILGIILISRLERPAGHDHLGPIGKFFSRAPQSAAPATEIRGSLVPLRKNGHRTSRISAWRVPLLSHIIDTYLVGRFLFYFVLLLTTFVLMIHVFRFFELLNDVIKNHIAFQKVLTYLFFLTPRMIYEFTPVSVLTSILVVFAILAKSNEITALKACGVSIYRLTVPILLTGLCLSGMMFAFDHYVVPDADRRQDALLSEIKGRPAQTHLMADRKWIKGDNDDLVYYYRYFDSVQKVMSGVNVFEIDPQTFRLKRHITATSARWEPAIEQWVFQNGWSRDMKGSVFGPFDDFAGQTRTFSEVVERPEYFVKEDIQSQQMNYLELRAYIDELQRSNFDTVRLQVQYYKKFSMPLFAFILALVSIPFAFQSSGRGSGAVAGFGISLIIFIVYYSVRQLFEQVGNLGQLDPLTAAWAPDGVFSLAGVFLLARVRS